eukprot:86697_1
MASTYPPDQDEPIKPTNKQNSTNSPSAQETTTAPALLRNRSPIVNNNEHQQRPRHHSSLSETDLPNLFKKQTVNHVTKRFSLENIDTISPQYKKKNPFFKHNHSGNSPLSLNTKKLKMRYFDMKSKLKMVADEPPPITDAKSKLKDIKLTAEMEHRTAKLYLAQTERLKCLNIWCDTLTDIHISSTNDAFAVYMNNMGRMTQNMEINDPDQHYLMNMKHELIDGLNAFNTGSIGKCKELNKKWKSKRNRMKIKDEFLSSIRLMNAERSVLLRNMKRYMASLGDHANKLKNTLGEQKDMMQYVPPNMNNTLDLDSDTEDINDNGETVTKFTIWSQTTIVLKAGWIHKRGQHQKQFIRRWFQLFTNKTLMYSTAEGANGVLKGHIDLSKVISITKKAAHILEISTESRQWILYPLDDSHCSSQRDVWYEIINGVTQHSTVMMLQCSQQAIKTDAYYMNMEPTLSLSEPSEHSELRSPSSSIDIPIDHEQLPPMAHMVSVPETGSDELPSQTPLKEEEQSVDGIRFLSLYDIVELVTSPKARGTQHQNVLLNTYTIYTTRENLLEVIFTRLSNIPDNNPGQIKVISLFKTWLKVENDFKKDDGDEEQLSPFALHFCKRLMVNTQNSKLLQKLSRPLIAQLSNFCMESEAYKEEEFAGAPSSKIPKIKSAKQLDLNMLDPGEVARQICLNEYEIFKKIKPEEFLKQKSSKKKGAEKKMVNEEHKLTEEELTRLQSENKEKASTQPNIDKMRDFFNRLSSFAQSEILFQMDLNQRCKIVSNLLDICRELEKYNNISSLCAIRAGLCAAPIHRLRKTWDNIPKKAKETMAHLDALFKLGNGQKNLRDRISIISQPAIPHLGIFLGDIVFIHDGNETFSKEDKKINWEKMKLLADRIAWISMFQQSQFVFKPVPIITEYIESKMKIVPPDFLYKLSRSVEPPANKKK